MIFNGRDAVSFFFVLSGFVLSYKYIVLQKPLDLRKFYISRFFRLWPPFFVAILMYCFYVFYHVNLLTLKKVVDIFVFNTDKFWEEAFLIRFHNFYYGPGWTLTIEMVASFLLPFYILIASIDKRLIKWLIVVLLIGTGANYFSSVHFMLGILITCYFSQINEQGLREKKWFKYRYLILALAILIWPIRYYDELHPFPAMYNYLANYVGIELFVYTGFAAAVFIVTIIYNKHIRKFLEIRPLVYIGKLSYSIYLVHALAISVIYDYFQKAIPFSNPKAVYATMALGYIILTFVLSAAMHYLVELPFIRIGKRVTQRLKPSVVIKGYRENKSDSAAS